MLSTSQTKLLAVILEEIQGWALRNFGHNHSKWDATVSLGSAGPCFGMLEEVGEFFEAKNKNDLDEMRDAVADFLIFSADFYCRGFGVAMAHRAMVEGLNSLDNGLNMGDNPGSTVLMGQIAHINLKSHQGIRGYTEPVATWEAMRLPWRQLLALLLFNLHMTVPIEGDSAQFAFGLLEQVWVKVKERNWNKNAESGATLKQL